MNKFLWTLGCCITLLYSCDCEDTKQSDSVDGSNINGKWRYQQRILNGVTTTYSEKECEREFMEFVNEESYQVLKPENCADKVLEAGSYSITTDTLNFSKESGQILKYKIVLLEPNTLVMDGNHDYDGDGLPDRVRLNFTR